MKKLKIILALFVVLVILFCVGAYTALKVFVKEDKIRNYIVEYAKTNLNREVSFDSLSFHFFGLDLNNFKMSEKSTLNDGVFVKSDKLVIDISLMPLLHKEIKINNITLKSLDVNVLRSKEGIFNFDDIVQNFQGSKEDEQKQNNVNTNNNDVNSSSFDLKIDNFNIENANISFKDYMNDMYIDVENFNMSIKHFSFVKEFLCTTSFLIKYKQDKKDLSLPINSEILVNLNNFDMNKIFLNIKELSTSIKDSKVQISGTVNGITVSDIDCNISLKDINEKTFEGFFDIGNKFNISSIDFKSKSTVNVSSMNAKIDSLSLVLPDSSSNISGNIDWSQPILQYDFNVVADVLLNSFSSFLSKNIEGSLKTDMKLTQNSLNGTMKIENFSYTDTSKFMIPSAMLDLSTNFDLDNKKANINKCDIKLADSTADIKGNINWNNSKNFIYNLRLNLNLLLDNIAKNFPEYNLAGQIKSNAAVSNTNFSGTLNCKNVAFDYMDVAKVSKLNLDLSAKSNKNITISVFNGVFNGGNFKSNGSYINDNVKLNFVMDKLIIKKSTQTTFSNTNNNKQEDKKQEQKQQTAKKNKNSNLNVYANIDISQIDVPYLTSRKATLNTSITGIKNSSLAKANGTFDLTVSSGTITNTKEFAQNKYAKIFLTIFNVLNHDKNSDVQKKNRDDIVYNNIKTDVMFTDGLMKTKNISIAMPATTITTTGTINFANEALNLVVNTGAYVSMKITGTLSDPKTSFDVVNTVSEVLSKTVLKNLFGK